jgi:hypothetical protein
VFNILALLPATITYYLILMIIRRGEQFKAYDRAATKFLEVLEGKKVNR